MRKRKGVKLKPSSGIDEEQGEQDAGEQGNLPRGYSRRSRHNGYNEYAYIQGGREPVEWLGHEPPEAVTGLTCDHWLYLFLHDAVLTS